MNFANIKKDKKVAREKAKEEAKQSQQSSTFENTLTSLVQTINKNVEMDNVKDAQKKQAMSIEELNTKNNLEAIVHIRNFLDTNKDKFGDKYEQFLEKTFDETKFKALAIEWQRLNKNSGSEIDPVEYIVSTMMRTFTMIK